MSDDTYLKLVESLNRFGSQLPMVPSFVKLLQELYTEEEADFCAHFPEGQFTTSELAKELDGDETELSKQVESMADKGMLFVSKTEAGENRYELTPWMPGVIEFSIIRSLEDPDRFKKIMEVATGLQEEVRTLMEPLMGDIESLMAMLPEPELRTMVVNEAIPDDREVHPYENLYAIIDKEESFAAMPCCCRNIADTSDEPCNLGDKAPYYSCLSFGTVADYIVERKFGKRITKEECKSILETCAGLGCVPNTNNFVEGIQFICNCCSCCCVFLRQIKEVGNLNLLSSSNFISVVDEETCTGCGDCVDRCPVNAMSLKNDEVASVNAEISIGCGNCVPICPTESLAMERRSNKKPELGDKMGVGLGF